MAEKKSSSYGHSKTGERADRHVLDRLTRRPKRTRPVQSCASTGRPAMGSGPADALPVRLDPELRRAVDERAAAEHTTSSEVVREALRRYLKTG